MTGSFVTIWMTGVCLSVLVSALAFFLYRRPRSKSDSQATPPPQEFLTSPSPRSNWMPKPFRIPGAMVSFFREFWNRPPEFHKDLRHATGMSAVAGMLGGFAAVVVPPLVAVHVVTPEAAQAYKAIAIVAQFLCLGKWAELLWQMIDPRRK